MLMAMWRREIHGGDRSSWYEAEFHRTRKLTCCLPKHRLKLGRLSNCCSFHWPSFEAWLSYFACHRNRAFQNNNICANTARLITDFLKKLIIQTWQWPDLSQDLNTRGHLQLKSKVIWMTRVRGRLMKDNSLTMTDSPGSKRKTQHIVW